MSNIQLISASAGSGKTTRLTQELTSLLKSYQPSEIIATTFTRAAAGELKSRVREAVIQSGDFYTASIIDEALIGTVNGIGGVLLERFAFEKGISPVLNVIQDEEKTVVFQMAVSNVLSNEDLPDVADVEDRLSLKKDDLRKQVESILDLARTNGIQASDLPGFKDLSISAFMSNLPAHTKSLQSLIDELIIRIPQLKDIAREKGDTTKATEVFLKEAGQFHYQLQHKFLLPWSQWSSLYNKGTGTGLGKTELLESVKKLLLDHLITKEFQNDLINYTRYCFTVCEKAMYEYEQIKGERGLIDFVDQEASLLELLDHPSVQKQFSSRYKILLVDEFQDTSPLQLALFLKMATLVEKVIWVGDPKQSIYGFRNSDSELINQVIKKIDNHNSEDILKYSWRSRPQLVNVVNQLFLKPFQREGVLSEAQIVLDPKRKERDVFRPALQLWGFQWLSPGNRAMDTKEKYLSHIASRLKTFKAEDPQIDDVHTRAPRSVKWSDIAILCRTNNNCRSVANALRKQGIQAVVADTGLQFTAEWRLLKACLHLLLDAQDNLAKAEIAFLSSEDHNISGLIEDRLEFLHVNGDKNDDWLKDHSSIQWLNENRERLCQEPLTVSIPLIYAALSFHRLIWQWGDGAQRQNNLDQILLYASRYEDYCCKFSLLPNAHGFLYWFSQMAENEKDEQGVTANEQSVNILTYHKAKGLEWPVVLMLDLDQDFDPDIFCARTEADDMQFEAPLQGRRLKYFIWPYGKSYGSNNAFKPFSERFESSAELKVERKKKDEENLRLLYVGFTRARDYLILGFRPNKLDRNGQQSKICWLDQILSESQKSFFEEVNFVTGLVETDEIINCLVKDVPVRRWISQYSFEADVVPEGANEAMVYKVAKLIERKPYLVNPSSASVLKHEYSCELVSIVPEVKFTKTQTKDVALFGSCIHHFMCAYRPEFSKEEALGLIDSLLKHYNHSGAVQAEDLYYNICAFYDWMAKELKPLRIRKEVPVMMQQDGQLIKGTVDLIVEAEEAVYIIDYKTYNPIETEDVASSFEEKSKSFSGQLGHYKAILEKCYEGKEVRTGIHFIFSNVLYWLREVEVEVH